VEGVIRRPLEKDIDALAEIYIECFPDRVQDVFGGAHRRCFIRDYLRFYLSWDPENNWVYEVDGKILGFVIGPCRYAPARAALAHGQVFLWLWHLLTGRYGLPFHLVRLFFAAGFAFNPHPAVQRFWGRPYVHLVAVARESQGMGIGSRLMGWTLEQYRKQGVDFCWLVVQRSHGRGGEFYRRFGFRVHETMANGDVIMVWGDPHDAGGHHQRR